MPFATELQHDWKSLIPIAKPKVKKHHKVKSQAKKQKKKKMNLLQRSFEHIK
jgi:hypothetical protein